MSSETSPLRDAPLSEQAPRGFVCVDPDGKPFWRSAAETEEALTRLTS